MFNLIKTALKKIMPFSLVREDIWAITYLDDEGKILKQEFFKGSEESVAIYASQKILNNKLYSDFIIEKVS